MGQGRLTNLPVDLGWRIEDGLGVSDVDGRRILDDLGGIVVDQAKVGLEPQLALYGEAAIEQALGVRYTAFEIANEKN